MESLTNRLKTLMDQIESNQMADLIEENRLNTERVMGHQQKEKHFTKNASESLLKLKQESYRYSHGITFMKNYTNQKHIIAAEELDRQRKKDIFASIFSSPVPMKDISNKSNDSEVESNASGKKFSPKNKFLRVARLLVVHNSMKNGHTVCTCNSLDSKCKVHDS
jgi:HJR/Mrr/RecB family endonuclease